MNRLTMESDKGRLAFTFDLDVTCKKEEMLKILKIGNALKEYEDLGLTPEQIREVDNLYAAKCREVAEMQRQLENSVKLPCKVGDTVYVLMERNGNPISVVQGTVRNILHYEDDTWWIAFHDLWRNISFDDFGKIAFLTREEAEKALSEVKA